MVFSDASRAFDKVWNTVVIFNFNLFGITCFLLIWFHSYLSDRVQIVVLVGQASSWLKVEAKVPHGSILGPLLPLIYTETDIHMFVDDSYLLAISNDPVQAAAD